MRFLLPLVLVLHVLAASFWLGVTGVFSNLGAKGASLPLRAPQFASSIAAILFGAALWWLLHPDRFGAPEHVLAVGALAAIVAAILQQAIAWPAARIAPAKFGVAQRISGGLLILALVQMIIFRFVS
jgi:hypothetical protein